MDSKVLDINHVDVGIEILNNNPMINGNFHN